MRTTKPKLGQPKTDQNSPSDNGHYMVEITPDMKEKFEQFLKEEEKGTDQVAPKTPQGDTGKEEIEHDFPWRPFVKSLNEQARKNPALASFQAGPFWYTPDEIRWMTEDRGPVDVTESMFNEDPALRKMVCDAFWPHVKDLIGFPEQIQEAQVLLKQANDLTAEVLKAIEGTPFKLRRGHDGLVEIERMTKQERVEAGLD